jgi:hypothetical protein
MIQYKCNLFKDFIQKSHFPSVHFIPYSGFSSLNGWFPPRDTAQNPFFCRVLFPDLNLVTEIILTIGQEQNNENREISSKAKRIGYSVPVSEKTG